MNVEHKIVQDDGLPAGKDFLVIGVQTPPDLISFLDLVLAGMGWDQAHMMFAVYSYDDGFALTDVPLPAPYKDMPPHIGFPGHAKAAWQQAHTRAGLAPYFTAKFYGWMIAFEAWGVTVGPDDPPEHRARLEQARRTRTFHKQPDRHECRILVLAGPEGLTMQLSRTRGVAGAEDDVRRMDEASGTFVDATRRYADLGARVKYLRERTETDSRR